MSQQAAPYPQYVMVPMRESNGLGVAGFFISLIGVFIPTGIVALLGLLVSLVALGKPPRTMASMGVLLGLFGTALWLAIMGVAVLGAVAVGVVGLAAGAAAFILTQPEVVKVTSDMLNITIAAVDYEERNGELPQDLAVLGLADSTLTDPWGHPYYYKLVEDEPGFDIVSGGGDKTIGTEDDVMLSRLGRLWEGAIESFGEKMEEFGQKMERLEGRNIQIGGSSFRAGHWSCDSKGKSSPAERYEAAAIAAAGESADRAPETPEPAPAPETVQEPVASDAPDTPPPAPEPE